MINQSARVQKMFGSIATRYDLANHVLSCGLDIYWRRRAAEIVRDWRPQQLADLATGTGDLALAIQKELPTADIVGADFLPDMLYLVRRTRAREVALPNALSHSFGDNTS